MNKQIFQPQLTSAICCVCHQRIVAKSPQALKVLNDNAWREDLHCSAICRQIKELLSTPSMTQVVSELPY